MIRRHVLAALATGVEAGDDDAARAALAQTEWVLRGSARRQLERALMDAALVSNAMVSSADPDSMRHVQRVAALTLVGQVEVDATRREDVTDAYAKLPPARTPAAPIATILACTGALAAVVLLVLAVIAIRTPASHRHTRGAVPLPGGAYFIGGAPRRDPALEHLFATDLAELVVQTDSARHGASTEDRVRAKYLAELRGSPVIAAHGQGLVGAWTGLLDALDGWVDAPTRTRGYKGAEERLRAAAQDISDQLAALGLAYHLEADVLTDRGAAHGAVFTYIVQDVVYVRAGGEPRRVLSLRRLDQLNVMHSVLGMQTETLGDPVVLLDQIDGFVSERLEPVLFRGEYYVGDDAFVRTTTGRDLAFAAGSAIGRELAPYNRNRARITNVVVATVRRHEARHGYDMERATQLRYPLALSTHVGDGGKDHAAFVARARAELAAYVSQIASDPYTPQLALWNLANLGFHKEHWGAAESYVAAVVIEGLARHLGVKPAPGPVIHDGHLDRNRLANLALPLGNVSDDDLRAAARRLWQELYGEAFIAIVDPAPIVATLHP